MKIHIVVLWYRVVWLVGSDVSEEHTASIFRIEVSVVKLWLSNIGAVHIFTRPTVLKMEKACSSETLIRSKPMKTCYRDVQNVLSPV
jgi:hypothetical protein